MEKKGEERVIDDFSKTFRDYDMKDGTELIMKELGKMSYRQQMADVNAE